MEKVSSYIKTQHLFNSSSRILVGLSGGCDSVVLLHMLTNLGLKCEAAHVNFKLRGSESDDDAKFCEAFAKSLNVKFHVLESDAKVRAATHGISVEMAAREIRYAWFKHLLEQNNLDYIAVAHHKNDQAETILMNLIRGTGVSGMKGMMPKNESVVRPLLCLTRKEIEAYSEANSLTSRYDKSNADTSYKRNNIRHTIMPQIEGINPAFIEHIDATAYRFMESAIIVENYIENWKTEHQLEEGRVPISALFNDAAALTLLHALLTPYNFSASAIQDIFQNHPHKTGAQFFSNTHLVLVDRDFLVIEPVLKTTPNFEAKEIYPINKSALPIHAELLPFTKLEAIPKESSIACLDFDTLTMPLMVRNWQQGDKFRPLGMKGFKKISDFLIDNKINLLEKQDIRVVTSGEEVVWVMGHRIDDRYKTTPKTKQILWLELEDSLSL